MTVAHVAPIPLSEPRITFPPLSLECHLVFFYDLKVRIRPISQPETPGIAGRPEKLRNFDTFVWRDIADSELNRFYFGDTFLQRWVRAHLHGTPDTISGTTELRFDTNSTGKSRTHCFVIPNRPCGVPEPVDSYDFLECTVFENGVVSVVLRFTNRDAIDDVDYVAAIARPEFLRSDRSRSKDPPGALLIEAERLVHNAIEPRLASCLNTLGLTGVHIDGGLERPIEVRAIGVPREDDSQPVPFSARVGVHIHHGETIDVTPALDRNVRPGGVILHRLRASRPFVGTVATLPTAPDVVTLRQRVAAELLEDMRSEREWRIPRDGNKVLRERVYRFAIAAARTTPRFLEDFAHLAEYWTEKPPRDAYDPGPSIVFIGRRGWVCMKMESRRDTRAFHLGVVETVLFVLQAVHASFRATRRFVEQIKRRGDAAALKLNETLSHMTYRGWQRPSWSWRLASRFGVSAIWKTKDAVAEPDDVRPRSVAGNTRDVILEFTAFLARARLTAPTDDMSTLVRSYLETHTGIASVRRIKLLLEYDRQVENAREMIANYAASLQGANQYWTSRNTRIQASAARLQLAAVALAVVAIVLSLFDRLAATWDAFAEWF
jgi:hypothetical protein